MLGEIAHIVAHSDDGPRADPRMPLDERDCYDNWILLCAHHHELVDSQSATYTVSLLRQWKMDHEAWVRDSLSKEIPNVTLAELHVVCAAFANGPALPPTDEFMITTPREKMAKNGLTNKVLNFLQMGLAAAPQVEEFLRQISQIDGDFPERLKNGFVLEFERLEREGLMGDALFLGLFRFCGSSSRNFREQAASLAVLAHLFHTCEVFRP